MKKRVLAQSFVIFVRVHASQKFKHSSKLYVETRNQVAPDCSQIDNLSKPLREASRWMRPPRRAGRFPDCSEVLNRRRDLRLSLFCFFLLSQALFFVFFLRRWKGKKSTQRHFSGRVFLFEVRRDIRFTLEKSRRTFFVIIVVHRRQQRVLRQSHRTRERPAHSSQIIDAFTTGTHRLHSRQIRGRLSRMSARIFRRFSSSMVMMRMRAFLVLVLFFRHLFFSLKVTRFMYRER